MRLIMDQQRGVIDWVAARLPQMGQRGFDKATSIGVLSAEGKPIAGIVYHDYHPEFATIMISFAATTPRWATHNMVGLLLGYPFHEYGCHKIGAAVAHTNARSLKLCRGIGLTLEGTLKDQFGPGTHAVMHRLFDKDYARLYDAPAQRRAA